ncbi:MAG: rRNA large subunit methyltransferase I, partial [Candidatus Eisenbacteria bacterium]|nr:rRNA large subunit methyltransferase I [Candidatus Eisenbacteria bacterium]
MKMLSPGGILITCSCSHHVTEELFHDVLAAAAADVHRRFRIVEKRAQGRDHPILVGFPESYYLKCFITQFLD